jgi:hypothetical protein
MAKHYLLFPLLFWTASCTTLPYVAGDCYLGTLDEDNQSYAQICFAKGDDSRGELIYYTRNILSNSKGNRSMGCRQKFDFREEKGNIKLRTKLARCDSAKDNMFRGSLFVISGVSFSANIDSCHFQNKTTLICSHVGSSEVTKLKKIRTGT